MGISVLAAVALGVTAVSAYQQNQAAQQQAAAVQQQAQAQKQSIQAQSRAAQVQAQRDRIKQIREARIRRAQVLSSAGQGGLGYGTSGLVGGESSISSQTAANVGAINVAQTFANQASAANQRAADAAAAGAQAQAKGQQWQTINTIFGANRSDFTTIFGGNTFPSATGK